MQRMTRRALARRLTAAVTVTTLSIAGLGPVAAQERKSVKIGYAVSKSGPNATGAGVTTIPNYVLWVKQVNEAGGLKLPDGSQLPIEVVEYDDRSSAEEVVRAVERLATQDQVDFILSPWGTGFNLAIAPLMDRRGYPHLAASSLTDKAPEFAARWKKSFWLLGGGHDYAGALAQTLKDAVAAGTINNKVAVVSVSDGFGIDMIAGARPAFAEAGLELVYDKSYPVGTSDFASMMNEIQGTGADSFVAFSYPPESFGLTKQAQTTGYNPKVFYLGVGGAFPVYPGITGGMQEGVMSVGGVDGTSDKVKDYFARHEAVTGTKPDSWASSITYASLEVLQQAIERQGLDRDKVAAEIASGEFDTIIGTVKMEDNQLRKLWLLGQWQGDTFVAVAPADRDGAGTAIIPKPAWQ